MSDTTDWIDAIASLVGSTSVILLYFQMKYDFDRSNRHKAYDVITSFSNNQTHSMTAAAEIVEKLNKSQIDQLIAGKEFRVPNSFLKQIEKCLEGHNAEIHSEKSDKDIKLTQDAVMDIRWHARQYLDNLEITLLSWRLKIASEEVIFEQMTPFLSSDYTMLRQFRKLDDLDTKKWPSIDEFDKVWNLKKSKITPQFSILPSR